MKKVFLASLVVPAIGIISLFLTDAGAAGEKRALKIRLMGEAKSTAPGFVTVADLEKLTITEYSVVDPYKKKPVIYRGVLLRDIVGEYSKRGVNKVRLKAIDDYMVEFVRSEWMRWDIMLATRSDGKHMTIKESGPARIVMPFDTARDIDKVVYTPKWIWLVNRIEFIGE